MRALLRQLSSRDGLARREDGVTLVEFAFVGPVLILLIMGIFDMSYQVYVRAILAGEVQKAGRDSSLETGLGSGDAIDDAVERQVRTVAPSADFDFKRISYRTFSEAAAAQEEAFTDSNENGICDDGESYEDANANNTWDADGGAIGQGGAKDSVIYSVEVSYARLFPMAGLIGADPEVTLRADTVLQNQPYDSQNEPPPVPRTCD